MTSKVSKVSKVFKPGDKVLRWNLDSADAFFVAYLPSLDVDGYDAVVRAEGDGSRRGERYYFVRTGELEPAKREWVKGEFYRGSLSEYKYVCTNVPNSDGSVEAEVVGIDIRAEHNLGRIIMVKAERVWDLWEDNDNDE